MKKKKTGTNTSKTVENFAFAPIPIIEIGIAKRRIATCKIKKIDGEFDGSSREKRPMK